MCVCVCVCVCVGVCVCVCVRGGLIFLIILRDADSPLSIVYLGILCNYTLCINTYHNTTMYCVYFVCVHTLEAHSRDIVE